MQWPDRGIRGRRAVRDLGSPSWRGHGHRKRPGPSRAAELGQLRSQPHGAVVQLNHPEYVVGVDVHVEVVNLLRKVGRSYRTGVKVKSNKDEGARMETTVDANELALAEAHVRLVGKRRSGPCGSVRSGPAAADVRQADQAVEVCYL